MLTDPHPSKDWPLAATLAVFVIAFAVIARPWLMGDVTIPWDAKAQFHPQLAFLARALAHGEWPFWTPSVFAGWPQIADPQSLIFSPIHLGLALVNASPSLHAADMATFSLLALGGLGIILIFRDRGWHPAGATVAALAFAFGGSAASRLQHTGQIASLAYLPLALWCLDRALKRSSARWGIAAGLLAGFTALDRDQVGLLALYLLIGAVLAHWIGATDRRRSLRASIRPLLAASFAGALLIVVPITMTALLTADSNRPVMDYISAGRGSLHPAHLLTLAFPDLYGANDPAVDYWGPPSMAWGPTDLFLAQNMGQLYLGSLPLIALLVLGIGQGKLSARDIRFVAIATALALLYAVGWYTPAFRVMFEALPGVALFRRPADASFILCGLLAIGGGYLIHRWLTDTSRIRPTVVIALAVILALTIIAATVAVHVGAWSVANQPIATSVAWLLGAVVALVVLRPLPHRMAATIAPRSVNAPGLLAMVIAALFMTADLTWNNGPNESTGLPPAMYDAMRSDTTNATITLLRQQLATQAPDHRDRVELTAIGYHWPNISLIHDFDHLFGHNPLRIAAFKGATGVGDTIAVADQRMFAPLFPSYRSLMADLFGLRLIATGVPIEQIDPTLKPGDMRLIARTADAYVYENPRALPRVLVATNSKQANFAKLLTDGQWPEFDPRRTVLLETPSSDGPPPDAAPGGTARVMRYGTIEIVVAVDAPAGGFLVLNDVWHPWWGARVNGQAVQVLKANVLFRAVPVPAGASTVTFTFHPFAGAASELRQRLGLVAQ